MNSYVKNYELIGCVWITFLMRGWKMRCPFSQVYSKKKKVEFWRHVHFFNKIWLDKILINLLLQFIEKVFGYIAWNCWNFQASLQQIMAAISPSPLA